jgi:GTPase SAR1 family protein
VLNLSERKQQLLKIMDGYQTLLERWADNVRSKDLCSIKSRIESGRYQIALIGSVKRGKSTLLNALLGNAENYALAPVNANTCTSAIVKYLDSALYPGEPGKNGVRVHFNDFRTPNPVFVEDASAYIDQTNRNFKEEYSDKIDFIEIYGNFPLIQTRGIFVDTPGREALHDQDYLSTEILKEVDVIICPIAADLPLDRQEIAFLGNLASLEREKLVFVLTKIDTLNQTELNETFNQIEQTLGEIPDLVRPLRMYKTAAKMVIEAYESNRTAMEIKTIKDSPECGLQEFEDALDGILRKGSQAEKSMGTGCKELEQWLGADKRRLEENMENCTRKSQELERERGIKNLLSKSKR